jgi:FtsZ-binding cell division protein ZapB
MSSTNEIDIVRKKVTGYLSDKKQLESDLLKSKNEVSKLNKELVDARKEIEGLTEEKKALLLEKANFQEAIKHLEALGKKDKKTIAKMEGEIVGLKAEKDKMSGEMEERNKAFEDLRKENDKMKGELDS